MNVNVKVNVGCVDAVDGVFVWVWGGQCVYVCACVCMYACLCVCMCVCVLIKS